MIMKASKIPMMTYAGEEMVPIKLVVLDPMSETVDEGKFIFILRKFQKGKIQSWRSKKSLKQGAIPHREDC